MGLDPKKQENKYMELCSFQLVLCSVDIPRAFVNFWLYRLI